jgi:hypothetical protein
MPLLHSRELIVFQIEHVDFLLVGIHFMPRKCPGNSSVWCNDDDDDVYLIENYNMAVGYKIYLHTNTDQLERHKYKMISIRKTYS